MSLRSSFAVATVLVASLAFLLGDARVEASSDLLLGAFNIQIFGVSKMKKSAVVDSLLEIVERYDILAVQEIRDASETAIKDFLDKLNAEMRTPVFDIVVSDRLGRSSSKEQYAFIYRKDKVSVADTYQDPDVWDVFQREPFVVRFRSPNTEISDFAVMVIHTSPSAAESEIDGLGDVYDDVTAKWNLQDVIIAGDFNADCAYVTRSEWRDIRLRTDTRFKWLIASDVDTTVGNTDCAYDRFVIGGKSMAAAIVPGSASVYRFDTELGLTNEEAADVSDHYPIELLLRGKKSGIGSEGNPQGPDRKIRVALSFTVPNLESMPNGAMALSVAYDDLLTVGDVWASNEAGHVGDVIVRLTSCADPQRALHGFQRRFASLMSESVVDSVLSLIGTDVFTSRRERGIRFDFDCRVVYRVMHPFTYELTITATLK